tara:strand:- start:173 stop:385 length:213 start_codon:yes stop_codon:yes gene_type:complete
MAQKALILDSILLDAISSGRCLILERNDLIALDDKMRLSGFLWHEHENRYIKVQPGKPPIRKSTRYHETG